jgi:hypothetical protein
VTNKENAAELTGNPAVGHGPVMIIMVASGVVSRSARLQPTASVVLHLFAHTPITPSLLAAWPQQ